MLKEAISLQQRAVEIRQLLTTGKLICLVESAKDKNVYGNFFDPKKVVLIPTDGKPNLLSLLQTFESEVEYRVFAIADADADRIRGVSNNLLNLFYTDCRDLEATIFFSPAFGKVARELADASKLSGRTTIEQDIQSIANAFGIAHEISASFDMAVKFDGWAVEACFDIKTLARDADKFFGLLNGRAQRNKQSRAKLESTFAALMPLAAKHVDFAPGDYLLDAFGFSLRRVIGNKKKEFIAARELAIHFRLAYEKMMFSATSLHDDIKAWADATNQMPVWIE